MTCPQLAPRNWTIERLAETGSTNAELARRARAGAPEGLVLLADHQTAGRGRQGRSWFSTPGGSLCFSALLRPCVAPEGAAALPLVVGVSVAEAIAPALAPKEVLIKWPNDILDNSGRKLCGILCEMGASGDAVDYVVAGIGLNVNIAAGEFPPDLAGRATSMEALAGRRFDMKAMLGEVLRSLGRHYGRWLDGGLAAVREALDSRDALRGRRVEMRLLGEPLAGLCEGVAPSGALLLRLDDGAVREVFSGEAHVVRHLL